MGRTLLAFDVGNSRVKIGLYEDGHLVARESMVLAADRQSCTEALRGLFDVSVVPDRCLIASVVRGAQELLASIVFEIWEITADVVTADWDLGIKVDVPDPGRVGIDRLLEASQAFHIVKDAVVVATFGSALTVDFVNAAGVFCGGTIAPGLRLGLQALHRETSLLPQVELRVPDSALGTDTPSCMQAGVVYGAVGAVERLYREFSPSRQSRLVLAGGDAHLIAPLITLPHQIEDDLVLKALVALDHKNRKGR